MQTLPFSAIPLSSAHQVCMHMPTTVTQITQQQLLSRYQNYKRALKYLHTLIILTTVSRCDTHAMSFAR